MATKRTSTTRTPLTILQETRQWFAENPSMWIKGDYESPEGRCLIRALRAFGRPGSWNQGDAGPYVGALMACSRSLPPRFPGGVTAFNDHPRTTLGSILALLDRAIGLLEGATA